MLIFFNIKVTCFDIIVPLYHKLSNIHTLLVINIIHLIVKLVYLIVKLNNYIKAKLPARLSLYNGVKRK